MKQMVAITLVAFGLSACSTYRPPETREEALIILSQSDDPQLRLYAQDQILRQVGASHRWDQFADEYGNLLWRCRNVTDGTFGDDGWCARFMKSDSKWPGPYL